MSDFSMQQTQSQIQSQLQIMSQRQIQSLSMLSMSDAPTLWFTYSRLRSGYRFRFLSPYPLSRTKDRSPKPR